MKIHVNLLMERAANFDKHSLFIIHWQGMKRRQIQEEEEREEMMEIQN